MEPPSPIYPRVNLCVHLLFLEQFSSQASLNFQESILHSVLHCAVLYCTILYCIVYSAHESKSPSVSKNRKIRAKLFLIGFVWEMEAPW